MSMSSHEFDVFGHTATVIIRADLAIEHEAGAERSNVDIPVEVYLDGEHYHVAAQRGQSGEWDALDPALDDDSLALRAAINDLDPRTSVPFPGSWAELAGFIANTAKTAYAVGEVEITNQESQTCL